MMKRMNFTIAEIQVKRLTSISKKTGMAASEIVRRAIDEYWERFERQGKRSG
jgi:predicted DNA-binding protein